MSDFTAPSGNASPAEDAGPPGRDEGGYARGMRALLKVTRILGSRVDFQQVLDAISFAAQQAFECHYVTILLLNEGSRELEVCSVSRDQERELLGHKQKLGDGVAGKVAELNAPMILGEKIDTSAFRKYQSRPSTLSASMVAPITLRDELIGVLTVNSRKPGQVYRDQDLETLQVFAGILGFFIRHYQQADWMRQTIAGLQQVMVGGRPRDEAGEAQDRAA